MGSACSGIIAFFTFLFILEVLETRSRTTVWRSSAPWLPLVGLTWLATIIHIPFYIVISVGIIYGVFAYRQTSKVRRLTRQP
jgi:ABC-type antimicrobial peptide transport system permease subunit